MQILNRLEPLLDKSTFIKTRDCEISRIAFFSAALNDSLAQSDISNKKVFVSNSNSLHALFKFFSALYSNAFPLFATNLDGPKDFDLPKPHSDLDITKSQILSSFKDSAQFGFLTSGSTGKPQEFLKTWQNLFYETNILLDLIQPNSEDKMISLVSPCHIYGFLFSFLVPLMSGAKINYIESTSLLDSFLGADNANDDTTIIVMTPALWPLAKRYIKSATRLIISSGAALSENIEKDFLELQSEKFSNLKMIEVLGSTETGGMGYRVVGENKYFEPFAGIAFKEQNDSWIVESPFIHNELKPYILSDRLEFSGDKFLFKGRADRIFKYSGKRLSLDDLEKNMSSVVGQLPVICIFEEIASEPKGGLLHCFIECAESTIEEPIQKIRERYLSEFKTPFPDRLCFLQAFPRNQMGKVVIAELLK